jgi:hypothetical protein
MIIFIESEIENETSNGVKLKKMRIFDYFEHK